MKMQTNGLFNTIAKTSLQTLVTTVKETIAQGFTNKQPKIFSAADMWNIQRRRKTFIIR